MARLGCVIVFLLMITHHAAKGQLDFGFGEANFTAPEGVITISVIKEGTNIADFNVAVNLFTFFLFDTNGFTPPPELPISERPNEAEMTDYVVPGGGAIPVVFPPSSDNDVRTINITLVQDSMFEPLIEGFYAVVTDSNLLNDAQDTAEAQAIRSGVALINIVDTDVLVMEFENTSFSLPEVDAMLDDLVFVTISIPFEFNMLPVEVEVVGGTATRGTDYEINNGMPLQLVFTPESSVDRLNVTVTTFADNALEQDEMFGLRLSIPSDFARPFSLGDDQAEFTIIDDDGPGVFNFEQDNYTVSEDDGFVEVCVVFFQPDSVQFENNTIALTIQTASNSAEGGGVDYVDLSVTELVTSLRTCYNISIVDDLIEESTENFTLSGTTFSSLLINGELMTVIFIEDDNDTMTMQPVTTEAVDPGAGAGLGGDPHFSVLLPTGQLICYSIQGEHGFTFNLISNKLMQVNALFVPDSRREEVTWIGALGIVAKGSRYKDMQDTNLRFVAQERKVYIGTGVSLDAKGVRSIVLSGGKLTLSENEGEGGPTQVDVVLRDVGLEFTVRFVKGNHLDMLWKKVSNRSADSHGLIGQFFRDGVEVDEARRFLQLPSPDMEPVPVMRKPVWHFMERETPEDQLCWVAMNPGYQGRRLIEGHYLDYLVEDLLAREFTFKRRK